MRKKRNAEEKLPRKGAKAQRRDLNPHGRGFFAPLRPCGENHRLMPEHSELFADQNILDAACLPVNRLAFERILSPD
jgi:hypothetical protein